MITPKTTPTQIYEAWDAFTTYPISVIFEAECYYFES